MRVLVTGAYGFIGRHLVAGLLADGCEVVGAGRDLELARRLVPGIDWVFADFNSDSDADDWLPRLDGIDAVINCAGILQSTWRDDAERIHRDGTIALFEACARTGVRRLIHVSAMSAESGVPTAYAASKAAADAALEGLDLNWLIIKPSLVVGSGSHGGTSMVRALAGFPLVTPLPGGGGQLMQPIAMADLTAGLVRLTKADEPRGRTLFAAGPEVMTLAEVVAVHRRWLGFAPARTIALPRWLMQPGLWLGDLLGLSGSPSAMRSTSMAQLDHIGTADPRPFADAAGLTLLPLAKAMAATPSSVQDRMHARGVFALAALHGAIALFWIASGLITLLPGAAQAALQVLADGGVTGGLAQLLVYGGAAADIALGALFLSSRWTRRAGMGQLALASAYLIGGTVLRPDLWADPLGPFVKVLPVMAATVVVMALAEKR